MVVAQPVSAAALTSVVADPVGDSSELGLGVIGETFQDIVEVSITMKHGRLVFAMEVAALIPASPVLSPGIVLEEWSWRLDADRDTFPTGFPLAPGLSHPVEFFVHILWDGTSFTGTVVDRRPLLTGTEAIVTHV